MDSNFLYLHFTPAFDNINGHHIGDQWEVTMTPDQIITTILGITNHDDTWLLSLAGRIANIHVF